MSSLAWASSSRRAAKSVPPLYDKKYEYKEAPAPARAPRMAELDVAIAEAPTDIKDLLASRSKQERMFARQGIRRGLFVRDTNRSTDKDPLMVRAVRNGRLDTFLRDIGRQCFICGAEGICRHRERPVIDAEIYREGDRCRYVGGQ